MVSQKETRVGIIGSGFIAKGLTLSLHSDPSLKVSCVLTRRTIGDVRDLALDKGKVTNSVNELVDNSDIVVECSGDPVHATSVLIEVMNAGIPVVTMDSELQVTTGSWLNKKGFITEAEGDQPGALAVLYCEALEMGFVPMVLGNIKGFLNHNPTRQEMEFWSKNNGISLQQVTSFTDGTKIQIEQALIANAFGAKIAQPGLMGVSCVDYNDGAKILAEKAESLGSPISDYVLSPKSPAGVFVAAKHNIEQAPYLNYYKLGQGPYYVLIKPYHLCHLEIPKTIRHVVRGGNVLLNNEEKPLISVAAVAKRRLVPGELIKRGIGSFDVRGEAINIIDDPNHLPIGLVSDVVIKHPVNKGDAIHFDDVEISESKALSAWQEIIRESV